MLAKFGMFMTDGAGKIGGDVVQRNRYGRIVRTLVIPQNPQTTFQQARRAQFSTLTSLWRALSLPQQVAWNDETANYPRTNSIGDTYYMTGQNLFIGINMNLWMIGLSTIVAPVAKRIPTTMTDATLTVQVSAADFTIHTAAGLTDSNAVLVVYASKGLSPGIFYVSTLNKTVGTHDLDDPSSYDFTTEYWAQYPFTTVGEKVFARVATIDIDCGCMALGNTTSAIVS